MKRLIVLIKILLFPLIIQAQEWTERMDSLAKVTESIYNLPHGICQAFALQESAYNHYAIRAEANYIDDEGTYAKNIRSQAAAFVKKKGKPSFFTEVVQRGQSYGLFQVMGQNLRTMGLEEPYLEQGFHLKDQFDYFGKFISQLLKKYNGNVSYVASAYNGGSKAINGGNYTNKGYVSNINRNLNKFTY